MKSKYLWSLIVLSTIAVAGLIVLQVYWVNNTFILREQDFSSNTTKALIKVASILEKEEAQKIALAQSGNPSISLSGAADSSIVLSHGKRDHNVISSNLDESRDSAFYNQLGESGVNQRKILKQSGRMPFVKGLKCLRIT